MGKKFNPDDYKGMYVMRCDTEKEAGDFCRVLHETGRKWSAGQSYEDTFWHSTFRDPSKPMYYKFNEGVWTEERRYCDDYTILYWRDFTGKEFAWDDLTNYDIVLTRDGDVRILIGSQLVDKHGYMMGPTSGYCCDLTAPFDPDKDIMAVRRPSTLEDMSFDAFEKKLGRLVYERDETVEMTLEEVCKALGKNVKIVKG